MAMCVLGSPGCAPPLGQGATILWERATKGPRQDLLPSPLCPCCVPPFTHMQLLAADLGLSRCGLWFATLRMEMRRCSWSHCGEGLSPAMGSSAPHCVSAPSNRPSASLSPLPWHLIGSAAGP